MEKFVPDALKNKNFNVLFNQSTSDDIKKPLIDKIDDTADNLIIYQDGFCINKEKSDFSDFFYNILKEKKYSFKLSDDEYHITIDTTKHHYDVYFMSIDGEDFIYDIYDYLEDYSHNDNYNDFITELSDRYDVSEDIAKNIFDLMTDEDSEYNEIFDIIITQKPFLKKVRI